ncbi:hypothetical protein ACF1FX_26585 [Streptomyces sp. NPDC014646]
MTTVLVFFPNHAEQYSLLLPLADATALGGRIGSIPGLRDVVADAGA